MIRAGSLKCSNNIFNLHSRFNTWLQWVGQRQLPDETRNIQVLGFSVPYIRGLTVYVGKLLSSMVQVRDTNNCSYIVVRHLVLSGIYSSLTLLVRGRSGCNFKSAIFNLNGIFIYSYDNALRWMGHIHDDKAASVQVMAWRHQATSHYLSQCWPDLCHHMASLGYNGLNFSIG